MKKKVQKKGSVIAMRRGALSPCDMTKEFVAI
jgi:hypothetical protein